ncbi:MAG TPA: glycogen synthase, partial [Polyangiaceae bacterium]
GLSRELELRGNAVEIILPKYDCMQYGHIWGLEVTYRDLWVPWFSGHVHCTVYFGFVHGRKCFFIEPHSGDNFFNRGAYYGFQDEDLRFAFFAKAALEYMLKSGKRPDVIHTHDWQAGLLPVLLYEIYKFHGMDRQRVCHTIHNFRHQGIVGERVLWMTGLGRPHYYFDPRRMQDDFNGRALNITKAAIVYSNFVTTVSPHHAWEARHTNQGFGLSGILAAHQSKFGGVLNGLDYETWNPETDGSIARRYSSERIQLKYENKAALRRRLLLADGYKPILAYVGRLDSQKGVHLIRHGLHYALNSGAQFVLLGASPEHTIHAEFAELKRRLNDNPNCHIELGFDEDLARLIYAGADLLVVPSLYEPCGLTQLIGLRYGTVPVVRAVGGLADTVFDVDYAPHANGHRNGYVFDHADQRGLESALERAFGLWNHFPCEFRALAENGMQQNHSWSEPGRHYVNIYDYIREK